MCTHVMRLAFGDFVIDFDERRLLSAQQEVRLTPKAFDLLRLLIETRPKALSKQEIFERLWPGTFVTENNLAALVADLRSSLGDQASEPRFIRTVYAFGYEPAAPVSPVAAALQRARVPAAGRGEHSRADRRRDHRARGGLGLTAARAADDYGRPRRDRGSWQQERDAGRAGGGNRSDPGEERRRDPPRISRRHDSCVGQRLDDGDGRTSSVIVLSLALDFLQRVLNDE